MDSCNGYTHYWSDDSYSQGSYPCPGPGKCLDTKIKAEPKPTLSYFKPDQKAKFPAWDEKPR